MNQKWNIARSTFFKNLIERIRHKLVYVSCKKLGLSYIQGHLIASDLIGKNSVIVDLGGNLGSFSKTLSERFGAVCYCAEPNPELYNKITASELVHKVNVAISDSEGLMELTLSENDEASSFFSGIVEKWGIKDKVEVQTMTLKTFCKKNHIKFIDLLKVDIEGSELNMLNSMSDIEISSIPQITIEFHEFLDESLLEPTKKAIARIANLDFITLVYSVEKYSDVLFINKKYCTGIKKFWYWVHQLVAYKA